MTVHDYLRVLRERWVVVLSAVLVALLAAGGTWFIRPAEYTATMRMYVSAQIAESASAAYQGAQLSEQRVTSYVELVSSTRVSQEVIRQLGLSGTPEEVARHITASSKLDSVLIDVAVTGQSPESAAAVANAVGAVFPRLVDEIERPASPTGVAPVAVRVVQPAALPAKPSSTGLPVTLALGLFAGLALGIAGAFTRNALDVSVRSPEHLRELTKAPNLGVISFDAAVRKRPLTVHEDPQSPRTEAFRQLRTNLQFVDIDNPRKIILVTSSMPSEGKTTTIANLAIALASAGQRVLVVEADLRRPKLADLFGIERSVGLTSILSSQISAKQAIQHWPGGSFDVLASGPMPPNPSELLASRQMQVLLVELRSEYDVILIDTPPLLPVTDAAALAPATDGALLLCRFKETNSDQVRESVSALQAVSAYLLGTIFTMAPSGPRAYGQYNSYHRAEQPIALTPVTLGSAPPTSPVKAVPVVSRNSSRHSMPTHRQPRPAPQIHPSPRSMPRPH